MVKVVELFQSTYDLHVELGVKRSAGRQDGRMCSVSLYACSALYIASAELHADDDHTLGRISSRILNFQGQFPWLSFYLHVSCSIISLFPCLSTLQLIRQCFRTRSGITVKLIVATCNFNGFNKTQK